MIVKVILEKSKVVIGILEGSKSKTSSLLFIINRFRSFIFFRKDPYI